MSCAFLKIPAELRNKIYDLLLISPLPIELCHCELNGHLRRSRPLNYCKTEKRYYRSGRRGEPRCLHGGSNVDAALCPVVLATNRQIYDEARTIFYSKNKFQVHDTREETLRPFLDGIGKHNACLIQHVVVGFPSFDTQAKLDEAFKATRRLNEAVKRRHERRALAAMVKQDPSTGFETRLSTVQSMQVMKEFLTGLKV